MWTYNYSYPDELYHYGVKGMKWKNHVYAQPVTTGFKRRRFASSGSRSASVASPTSKSSSQANSSSEAQHQARVAKAKKAAKIGAAVVGTALAAYGAYKLAKYTQGKRSEQAMAKASNYLDQNIFGKIGESRFGDGTREMYFRNKAGSEITTRGARNVVGKAVGEHNARVIAESKQIYKNATNTKFDRGLAKVVNAGDSVKKAGSTATSAIKKAGSTATSAVKKAGTASKNRVLDVVNPIYEYKPGNTTSSVTRNGAMTIANTVTNYYKTKKRR